MVGTYLGHISIPCSGSRHTLLNMQVSLFPLKGGEATSPLEFPMNPVKLCCLAFYRVTLLSGRFVPAGCLGGRNPGGLPLPPQACC